MSRSRNRNRREKGERGGGGKGENGAHLNAQVGVQEDLTLEGLVAVVGDDDGGDEALLGQGDAVDEGEGVGPEGGGVGVEGGGGEAEVELDAGVGGPGRRGRLGRRLAEELPPRGAREPVLRQARGRGVVGGRAEDLWRGGRTRRTRGYSSAPVRPHTHSLSSEHARDPSRRGGCTAAAA